MAGGGVRLPPASLWQCSVVRPLLVAASASSIAGGNGGVREYDSSADKRFERAIADLRAGERERALGELHQLIDRFCNFRLAYLVRRGLP